MKVLIVVDKSGTAIDRLAHLVRVHNPAHEIKVLPIHPKRNDVDTMYEASNLLEWANVVDIHYWKSGEILKTNFPGTFEKKPKILFHFNPYDFDKMDWSKLYEKTVVGNTEIQSKIAYAHLIPYGVDLEFFTFNEDYTEEKVVMMSVARIEGKKGILEVARACKELGYKFKLVGRVSSGEYLQQILEVGGVQFIENATDEILRKTYYEAAIHVCNSVDNFESGTLPILESMVCGLPVLTRSIGHVPDIYDGKNMVVRMGTPEDMKDLKKHLKQMMENRDWRLKLREKAWNSVRNRDSRLMARKVMKLYNELYLDKRPLISVIMPTRNNPKAFGEALISAVKQDYKKFEVIIADSGDLPLKKIVDEVKKNVEVPIKYFHFPHKDNYTLAEARNRAIIEAEGEILVFCDDRIAMEPDALTEFAKCSAKNTWLWGVKDGAFKGFVENFASIRREDLINGGMFNERIQWYGGMTQEVRTRFEKGRGFEFLLIDAAKAHGVGRSGSKKSRRSDIINAKLLVNKLYN